MPIVGELEAVVELGVYLELDACGIHPWHGIVSNRATQLPRRSLGLIDIDIVG
jgi:hypothetical protein